LTGRSTEEKPWSHFIFACM